MADDSLITALSGFSGFAAGVRDVLVPHMNAKYQSELDAARDERKRTTGLADAKVLDEFKRTGDTKASKELEAYKAGLQPKQKEILLNEDTGRKEVIEGDPGQKIGVTKWKKPSLGMVPIIDSNGDTIGYTQKGAVKQKPPTQNESTNATYANRIEQSNAIFNKLEGQISQMSAVGLGTQRILPDILKSGTMKSQTQAERNFLNATLRRESGAVISPTEFEEGRKQYFPQPGDTEDVLKQKKQNREIVMKTFIKGAGTAYEPATLEMPGVDMGTRGVKSTASVRTGMNTKTPKIESADEILRSEGMLQ